MTGRNSLLVFLQTHNEVDQITPVLYKIGKRGNISADVVLSPNVSPSDYRISEIGSFDAITIYGGETDATSRSSFLKRRMEPLKDFGRKLPTEIPEKLYREHVADTELDVPGGADPSQYAAIAFDWSLAKHYRTDYLAGRDDVTTIVLPHGDSPFRNRIIKESKFDDLLQNKDNFTSKTDTSNIGFHRWTKMTDFDHLLFPNWKTARRVADPATHETIKVLGSPRYNREWLDVLAEIRPIGDVHQNSDCNVVVFLRTEQYFIFTAEVKRTLRLLSKFSDLSIIVKEHPRDRLLDTAELNDFTNIRIVKDELQSTTLIEWGDVFLSLGTTITFEPAMRRKPVLALEYAHANQSIISQYFSNADMRCKDDLYETLHTLLAEGSDEFYDDEEHRKFESEMVTSSSESVLDSWAECIEHIVRNEN